MYTDSFKQCVRVIIIIIIIILVFIVRLLLQNKKNIGAVQYNTNMQYQAKC